MRSLLSIVPLALLAVCEDAQIPLEPAVTESKPLTLETIPHLGFGTWNLKGKNVSEAVSHAIQVGYRHIDAAAIYGNEAEVGNGIADGLLKTGLRREDLWITSKLWNDHHDVNSVEAALDTTLQKLRLDYLDLYHMHWPVADSIVGKHSIDYRGAWGALTVVADKGKARHIGVCNFSPAQLSDLLAHTTHPPAVHQMELHPYLQQRAWLDWHRARGIHVTAYSPLAGTNPTYEPGEGDGGPVQLLNNSVVRGIARKRACTPAQVVLKWGLARGTSVIPKSIHRDRIAENFGSAGCALRPKDLRKIDALGKARHRYNSPGEGWNVGLFEGLEDADGKHGKANFTSVSG